MVIDQKKIYRKKAALIVPEPNDKIPSKFVMDCLGTESEGDGLLYAALLEDKLLYIKSQGMWYIWQGTVWSKDKVDMSLGLVRYVADRYGDEILALEQKIEELKSESDEETRKSLTRVFNNKIAKLQNRIKSLRQEKGRNSCLKFAHTNLENPFAIDGGEFDQDPWLLGVQNGVIDLRSGILLAGEPSQLISKQCSCNCPDLDTTDTTDWLKFLKAIYNNDQEIIDFMQRLLGYALTGLTTEHVFPFLLGRGRNGKSLLMSTIMRVMGDYAAQIPSDIFLKTNQPRSASQADPAIMRLEGLRLAVSSEVEEGAHFSSKEVKRLTGGDTLEGRNPYDKELRNFEPTHTMFMIGNHEPVPPAGDPAFWDRTFLIGHPIRFVKGEPQNDMERIGDHDMEEKLLKMDEQVLAWMLEGCLLWQANGKKLDPPASVLKATEEYQEDADWCAQFLNTCCLRVEANMSSGSTEIYTAFAIWYQENINTKKNLTPSQRSLGLKIKARGEFKHIRRDSGIRWGGLALNAEWQKKMLDLATNHDHGGEP